MPEQNSATVRSKTVTNPADSSSLSAENTCYDCESIAPSARVSFTNRFLSFSAGFRQSALLVEYTRSRLTSREKKTVVFFLPRRFYRTITSQGRALLVDLRKLLVSHCGTLAIPPPLLSLTPSPPPPSQRTLFTMAYGPRF